MSALQSAKLDDYIQRTQLRGEVLSAEDQRKYDDLCAQSRKEWERETYPHPFMYGGDYADVF